MSWITGIQPLYFLSLLLLASVLCGVGFAELIRGCIAMIASFKGWKTRRASISTSKIEIRAKGIL